MNENIFKKRVHKKQGHTRSTF